MEYESFEDQAIHSNAFSRRFTETLNLMRIERSFHDPFKS